MGSWSGAISKGHFQRAQTVAYALPNIDCRQVIDLCDEVRRGGSSVASLFSDTMAGVWLRRKDLHSQISLHSLPGLYAFMYWYCFVYAEESQFRTEVEAETIAHAMADLAVLESPWPGLPITALMLAAYYWSGDTRKYDFGDREDLDEFLGFYFISLVSSYGLRRFVTLSQREQLRLLRPASMDQPGISLPVLWAWRIRPDLQAVFNIDTRVGREALQTWFYRHGAVELGLDYAVAEALLERMARPEFDGTHFSWDGERVRIDDRATLRLLLAETAKRNGGVESINRKALTAALSPAKPLMPNPASSPTPSPLKPIEMGKIERFGTFGSGLRLLIGAGWANPEADRVWATKPIVSFAFTLPPGTTSSLELGLLLAWSPEAAKRLDQTLAIVVNGVPAAYCKLDDLREDKELVVPLGQQNLGASNFVQLICSPLFCPASLGINAHDTRCMGVAVRHFWVGCR